MSEDLSLPIAKNPQILKRAAESRGKDSQIDVAIDALAGLVHALVKYRAAAGSAQRQRKALSCPGGVTEEMAETIVSLTQLCMVFGNRESVQRVTNEKVNQIAKTI